MIRALCTLSILWISSFLIAQTPSPSLDYYLPEESYDPNIPTPADYLGFEIGKWHLTHDQLVGYFRAIAAASDRITYTEYARSYEDRPLVYLTITSVNNHQNLAAIQQEHLDNLKPGGTVKSEQGRPVVVYQGMSIHGNEPSGGNAAPLVAYYLAASQSQATETLLKESVILLDPCYNPDGFHRFSTWVNSNKGNNLVMDAQSRELNEPWPAGRTNHYWFDLNRDWLPVQHPESQGRIRTFHQWKPNVLTDHHEMGTNSTFFFQPGVPQRTNPLTPPKNQELTEKIGRFHAKALDEIGSLYFTQERFDDYYYGKGSTYPDINGCIGILFEQASSRGHLQESVNGPLSFPFTIRNQFTTALSTLEASQALRTELLDYQRDFFQKQENEAKKSPFSGYLLSAPNNPSKLKALVEMMELHQIEMYQPKKDLVHNGQRFSQEESVYIPVQQAQAGLVQAMFFEPTSFKDSLFYDISAWTMYHAFNLQHAKIDGGLAAQAKGSLLSSKDLTQTGTVTGKSAIGYYFAWSDYLAPAFLYQLQKAGLNTKVSLYPFTDADGKEQMAGTIFVASQNQPLTADALHALLEQLAQQYPIQVQAATSGWNAPGPDLGSNDLIALKQPKVLLLTGSGTRSYDVGEIWHLLDQRYQMEVSLIDVSQVGRNDLSRYNVIIMASGSYRSLNTESIRNWVQDGGTLICYQSAVSWAISQKLTGARAKSRNNPDLPSKRPYAQVGQDRGAQVIGGAIFGAKLDLTHPLAFGYPSEDLPLFRRGTLFLQNPNNVYAGPLRYGNDPMLTGYISEENLKTLSNSTSIVASGLGRGKVLCFADNTNFRAFWYGTNKLLANAMFFGAILDRRTLE